MATTPPNNVDPSDLIIIPVEDFTEAKVEGKGVYDILMQANAAHLEKEFNASRIKGNEYAQIYLGTMQATMDTAVQFFIQRHKLGYEAKILEIQAKIAEVELSKANVELEIARLNAQRIPAEIDKLVADTAVSHAQKLQVEATTTNLIAESANIPKQGALLDVNKSKVEKEVLHITAETLNVPKQGQLIEANRDKVSQEKLNLQAQKILVERETDNALIQGTVLTATECKLRAEYDLLFSTLSKVQAETSLLDQKTVTERAQTSASVGDEASLLGRQRYLHKVQADGFLRDAEQKAAKLMIDTWNVRRTTDEGTEANASNRLSDSYVGSAVNQLLNGISVRT